MTDSGHGRWTFRANVDGRQVSGGTYATWTEARDARRVLAARADAGKVLADGRVTLGEYLPRWLDRAATVGTARTRKPLAPATLDMYRRYVEQDIAPSGLARMKLRDVRRRHVQQLVDELGKQRGAATVKGIVAVLQGCLSSAVRDELISESPAHDLDLPPVDTKPFEPWTLEQTGQFLDVATGHRLSALFEVTLWTGMRRGSLLALDWADVDLVAREVLVRTTKSGRLLRVPLSDQAVDALRRWKLAQGAGGAGLVFTMPDGTPLRPQYATRLFDRLRVQAGLPKITLHGLRHMAASLLLASGADIEFVSKVLDHSNVRVTSGIYSHLLPGAGQGHANRAAAMVPRKAG